MGLDAAQYAAGEGPCLTAAREGHRVDVPDLAVERRWPAFTASVPAQRVRSVLSVPLHAGATADALAAITGLALAAATARQQADELTSRVMHMEHFVARLAHDLRGGMSTALIASEVVAHRRWQLDPTGQEALDLLVDELAREHRLLVDLLNLTRAATEADLRPPTTLLPLVQEVVRQRRRRIQVQTEGEVESAEVAVHPRGGRGRRSRCACRSARGDPSTASARRSPPHGPRPISGSRSATATPEPPEETCA
jgi:signal transduction histidine kinase